MKFRFLGTGTSSGVPAIACDCSVCTSSDPHDTRLRTGACVEFTDSKGRERVVLIDATPDLRRQALSAGLRRCDAIVFTHNHVDHVFGLDEVRRFNAVQQTAIEVYAEEHTMGHLRRVYQHIFEADRNVNDSFVAALVPRTIEPDRTLDIFGMHFTPVRLLHGKLPIVGYRIEPTAGVRRAAKGVMMDETSGSVWARRTEMAPPGGQADSPAEPADQELESETSANDPFPLMYCTDVSAIPPESWRHFRGIKTLVIDALRHRKHPTHMTVDEALNVADRVGPKQTWFVHMSHDLGHEETNRLLPDGVRLAYDGLVLGPDQAGGSD